MNGVLQDALKQQGQFVGRLVAIFLGQLDHCILDNVERYFIFAHCIHGLFEGPAFNHFREIGEFFIGGHAMRPLWVCSRS